MAWWTFVLTCLATILVSLFTPPEPQGSLDDLVFNFGKSAEKGAE
jgi:hypothetical protein